MSGTHSYSQASSGCLGTNLDDPAHGLVAEDVAVLHRRDHTVIDVQVGVADCASGDSVATLDITYQ